MKPWAIAVLLLAAVLTETALARPSDADEEGYQEDQEGDDDGASQSAPAPLPVLKSTPLNLTPKPGETITLPCVVDNAPSVVWLNGTATIAIGARRFTNSDDDRLSFSPDHTMTLKNIQPSDSNKYECRISNSLSVVHNVKVYEPPRILWVKPADTVYLEKGEHVTLNCSTTGFPEPRVSWSRRGRDLPGHKAVHWGDHLHYSHVDLRHTGTYVCKAANALGEVERSVYLGVRDIPDVTSVNMVNTKLGGTAEVACVVHAHPPAVIEWRFGKELLRPGAGGRVELVNDKQHELDGLGQRHVVRVTGVTADDLGTYYCIARNQNGTARRAIKLSGLPTPAKLELVDYVQGRPVLHWTVESQEPVTKYEMMYRKTDPISDWTSIELPAKESEGNVHKVKFELDNVEATNYEATLKSRNSFGWSDMSQRYPFKAESSRQAELSRMKEPGNGAPIERISFGLVLGAVAVLLART